MATKVVKSKRDSAGRQIWYVDGKRVSKAKAMAAKGVKSTRKTTKRKTKRAPRCTARNPCAKTKTGKQKKQSIERRKKNEYGYVAPNYYAYAKCSNPLPCNWDQEEMKLSTGESCCRKKY